MAQMSERASTMRGAPAMRSGSTNADACTAPLSSGPSVSVKISTSRGPPSGVNASRTVPRPSWPWTTPLSCASASASQMSSATSTA